VLGEHVRPGEPVALVDYPNHANSGDSAIWSGEAAYLGSRDVPVGYTCDFMTFSPRRLREHIGDGTILLHGGGSVGDVWEQTQEFRELVVSTCPGNKIVQLPQTIHFDRRENLERASAVFGAHPDFTLLVRDNRSLAVARDELGVSAALCPDMAFSIGPVERPAPPSSDVVWLGRTDIEGVHQVAGRERPGVRSVDWIRPRGAELPWRLLRYISVVMGRRIAKRPASAPVFEVPTTRLQNPLAAQRVRSAFRILASGRVVITDRLHGHILCVLLGIPHVLLDNSYGKIGEFHRTWTAGYPLVRWATSPEEALTLAADLGRTAPSP
jgi:exopolysaccharide biosynthesis predicted pyruvyltransferase EpsI